MSPETLTIGFRKEWQAFFKRHPLWSAKLKLLHSTLEKTFIREIDPKSAADKVVFFLGRLVVEDFNEIFLLCGNGYGFAGLKILRGLYERVVTSGYIAKNPNEAESFLDYHHIQKGKMLFHSKKFFGNFTRFSPEEITRIKKLYEQNKIKFQEIVCKQCGTTRTQFSWTKLDLLSMAKKIGLDNLYFPGYFYPTLQTHATLSSLSARIKIRSDGGATFDCEVQREWADNALNAAHNLQISNLLIQNSYFNLHLDQEIEERKKDFMEIWAE
jgi:hypothetical protein